MTEGQVVAIDGKTLRGSYNREDRASTIHMINAYVSSSKLVLGQLKTEQKSNEITAIPELIKILDIKGALVTIDAMACQTKIAKSIVDKGADCLLACLLAVKSNQGKRRIAVEKAFAAERESVANNITFEKGHSRIESRQCHVFGSDKLEGNFSRWKDLKSIIIVEKFHFIKGKKLDLEYRYYISSKELTAEQAASAIRDHWNIESMHWVLDVSMNEDTCQIYKDHGAENLACLRHMDLNMLRAEPTKLNVVGKQKRCMMNTSMLEAVLSAGFIAMAKN